MTTMEIFSRADWPDFLADIAPGVRVQVYQPWTFDATPARRARTGSVATGPGYRICRAGAWGPWSFEGDIRDTIPGRWPPVRGNTSVITGTKVLVNGKPVEATVLPLDYFKVGGNKCPVWNTNL